LEAKNIPHVRNLSHVNTFSRHETSLSKEEIKILNKTTTKKRTRNLSSLEFVKKITLTFIDGGQAIPPHL